MERNAAVQTLDEADDAPLLSSKLQTASKADN